MKATLPKPPTRDHAPAPTDNGRRALGAGAWLKGKSQVASARVLTYALYGSLVLALVMAAAALVRPQAKPPATVVPEATVGPEGFAEMFVAEWLTAEPGDNLAPFWPGRVDFGSRNPLGNTAGPPPPRVMHTASIAATQIGPDYWSVTVAAQTQTAESDVTTRFFRVPVVRTPDKVFVAPTTPSEVAGPVGSRMPDLAVGGLRQPKPNDPVAASVGQFLAALLTGKGELGRYIAPDSTVRPILPVPFIAVEVSGMSVRRLSDASHLEVVAAATGIDSVGHLTALTYPLELVQREGRWEVVRVIFAPSLSPNQPDLTPPAPVASTSTIPAVPTTPTSTTSTTIRRNP